MRQTLTPTAISTPGRTRRLRNKDATPYSPPVEAWVGDKPQTGVLHGLNGAKKHMLRPRASGWDGEPHKNPNLNVHSQTPNDDGGLCDNDDEDFT